MKGCSKCQTLKQVSEFGLNKRFPDGRDVLCRPCKQAKERGYYHRNKGAILSKRHGLTQEDVQSLLTAQNNSCAICSTPIHTHGRGSGEFVIDHSHETMKVRGLLCNTCNVAIGKLGDSAVLVAKALDYLTK